MLIVVGHGSSLCVEEYLPRAYVLFVVAVIQESRWKRGDANGNGTGMIVASRCWLLLLLLLIMDVGCYAHQSPVSSDEEPSVVLCAVCAVCCSTYSTLYDQ